MPSNLVAMVLTYGRPNKQYTTNSIRRAGYTGPIKYVISDDDKTLPEYIENYGDDVLVFNKEEIAETFDEADNFGDRRSVVYARNAAQQFAKELGYDYQWQLDDDYTTFRYRWTGIKGDNPMMGYHSWQITNMDSILESFIRFMETTPTTTIAMSQGGDIFGGKHGQNAVIRLKRKAMNSFLIKTDRPITFMGRINEDVNNYTLQGLRGDLYFTYMPLQLEQHKTQSNSGGMTDIYLDSGTYIKSFYTIMFAPSCVDIRLMGWREPRLHHHVEWNNAAPKIIPETTKQKT